MGIQYLNRFLKENAINSIILCNLTDFSGKKIAVDISIYMYRFASENTLIENIYLMLSMFRYYNITPIFIFDGKPLPQKLELLKKRKAYRKDAEEEYNKLKSILDLNKDMDEIERQELIYNMDMLKRNFITINKNDIENVKVLIRSYGATYFDAPNEADELCAMLTIKEKVWACLSEDMDMFVYGCPRVIRYLSLLNHTAVLYDTTKILNSLGISQKELREICVLSGTDYNSVSDNNNTLTNTLKIFKKYRKSNISCNFYEWIKNSYIYENYINDLDLLNKIYDIFDLSKSHYNIKVFEKIRITNSKVNNLDLKYILKHDGFIFPNK